MLRRFLAVVLGFVLCSSVSAQPTPDRDMRAWARHFKVGNNVTVKLIDKTTVKGKLDAITDAGITVVDGKTEASRPIPYEQVQSLEKSTPRWAWIVLGAVAAPLLIVIIAIAAAGGWKS